MPEQTYGAEPDLMHYVAVLRRGWWIIVLITLLVMGGTGAAVSRQPHQYTAQAQLLLQPDSLASVLAGTSSGALSATDVLTQIQIVTSAPVKTAVAKDLGVDFAQVPTVSVSEVSSTDVIQISATSSDPKAAARIANDYANEYLTFRQSQAVNAYGYAATAIRSKLTSLNTQLAQAQASHQTSQITFLNTQLATYQAQLDQLQVNSALAAQTAQLVTPAVAPSVPSSPRPKLDLALALVVGLALGVGVVLLREALDRTVKTAAGLEGLVRGLPTLGVIPGFAHPGRAKNPIVLVESPHAPAAEAYRQLRTSLRFLEVDKHCEVIQITSPSSGDGKTTTAINLAVSMAQAGSKVILVDADLRRPAVHEFFGLEAVPGLTEVLVGDQHLDLALRKTPLEGLSVLTCGVLPPLPSELLSSQQFNLNQARLRSSADYVVIDGPPVLHVADALALSARVDGVILVARAGKTTRDETTRSLRMLDQVNAPVVGVVLNDFHPPRAKTGPYGYGYGYAPKQPAQVPAPQD